MLSYDTSRSGERIPLIDGKALISRFDPHRDAERFVQRTGRKLACQPKTVVIIGDVCGYIATAARHIYPDSLLIGFCLHTGLKPADDLYNQLWVPGDEPSALFIDRYLTTDTIEGLHILQWEPAIKVFPYLAASLLHEIERRARILNGNITTTRAFGERWIRNSLLNFLFTPRFGRITPGTAPIVIAASGPGLSEGVELLGNTDLTLFALPSSLCFLKEIGRSPDLLIQTDPGYYAGYHLRELPSEGIPIAAPLSAAASLSSLANPLCLLDYGEPFERMLIEALGVPVLRLPEMGTVAATAMGLALELGAPQVIMAGLDLKYRDIYTHVRPHTFDPVFESSSDRTSPYYSRKFRYSRDSSITDAQSPALRTYQEWFARLPLDSSSRVVRHPSSGGVLPFPRLNGKPTIPKPLLPFNFSEVRVPPGRVRKENLLQILHQYRREATRNPEHPLIMELLQKGAFTTTADRMGISASSPPVDKALGIIDGIIEWLMPLETG